MSLAAMLRGPYRLISGPSKMQPFTSVLPLEDEAHRIDSDGRDPALRALARSDDSYDVHLGQHLAAKYITAPIGVGRHCEGSCR